ncbi:MAG: glycoside hydrolase family 57 protein [Candidatus Omnitrophica bacterium]|nr:glycoside hydrolase family 57 protein [Candidatus Omnitrophota bacterium]MDD5352475.1 glycoside hydrolase family 57 protein [Candidatus Omnitrophota bacterium]MDD5550073.1 glycoside hydrolase family 57 protein [Candidatus Omnitrophota bacterium]
MLYLSFIWHMHQPYYRDLLSGKANLPWVRLHGIKDYLDMVTILEGYPNIHQTFNLVPSLIEQINSYTDGSANDKFFELSKKRADSLSAEESQFITGNFFMADKQKILALHPRYYELYFNAKSKKKFSAQDLLDLQVWFNLAWFDPYFRENIPELKILVKKARFFNEEDKNIILNKQIEILKEIIPTYKKYQDKGQIEISISPFYHPILPLLYNTKIAKDANKETVLLEKDFSYPDDCRWHIREAVKCYKENFGKPPQGMWPSEEAVAKQVMPLFIENGINWVVTDESILLKRLKRKVRTPELIYKSYALECPDGDLNVLFRDRNISDLIGFVYQYWETEKAVDDFMFHLTSINKHFKNKDCLVVVALDGENAWEYYKNDGRDFLNLLYSKISNSEFIKAVTVSEYLALKPNIGKLSNIAAGSWINGDFTKWIGNPAKNKAWDLLLGARKLLEQTENPSELAWKQIHILEGSDWFWWYGDKQRQFDELFRMHLRNFYKIINQSPSVDLDKPLE